MLIDDNSKNMIIAQSNKLTMAKQKMSISCRRMMYLVIYKIRELKNDEIDMDDDITPYKLEISMKEFKKYGVIQSATILNSVMNEVKKYSDKNFQIEIIDKERNGKIKIYINTSFILQISYNKSSSMVTMFIGKPFIKLIRDLDSNFTIFNPLMPIKFKSVYTQRFFEICHMYETYKIETGRNPVISIKYLLEIFDLQNVQSYKSYSNVKQKIIDVAYNELDTLFENGMSDIMFKYKKIKNNIGDYSIELDIKTNNKVKLIHSCVNRVSKEIVSICNKYIKNQCSRIDAFGNYVSGLSKYKAEKVKKRINDTITRYEGKSNPEIAKILSSVIKEEYGI